MIESLGRAEWVVLSERVAGRLGPVFDRSVAVLGPVGQKMAAKSLGKLSLASSRSVIDVVTVVALQHAGGDDAGVIESADIVRAVPFTGDHTIFEPVRQVFALAVRSAARGGGGSAVFERLLSFGENGGEPGPAVMTPQLTERLGGLLVKDNVHDDHSIGSKPAHVTNICIDVREFATMWAFGGSAAWPQTRIDDELTACTAELQALGALA